MAQNPAQPAALPEPAGERVPPQSVLAPYVSVDPGRMGGQPCFTGTRVPVHMLFDHLRMGSTIDGFVADFPPVTREQAAAVIELAQMGMLEGLRRL